MQPASWDLRMLWQGEELAPVRGKAEKMGVKQIYIDDLREEFVKDYVFPMFRYIQPVNSISRPISTCSTIHIIL